MVGHCLTQGNGACHIVIIISKGDFAAFANCLIRSKMDDGVYRMYGKNFVHLFLVTNIRLIENHFLARDFLYTSNALEFGIAEIIHHYDFVAFIQKL